MDDDPRWLAPYLFTEELWRGRARLLWDPALERAWTEAGAGVAHGSPAPLCELMDALVPVGPSEPVVVVIAAAEVRAELMRLRPGVEAIGPDAGERLAALLAGRGGVDVALLGSVHASGALDDARLAALGPWFAAGGVLAVWGAPEDRGDGGTEDALALLEQVRAAAPAAALYGMATPRTATFVAFAGSEEEGAAADAAAAPGEPERDDGAPEDDAIDEESAADVPLTFDNRLADEQPRWAAAVVVAGAPARLEPLAPGVTLVEVAGTGEDPELASLRAMQLEQLREQLDVLTIERQVWIERLDASERERAQLEDALAAAGSGEGAGPAAGAGRDAAVAELAAGAEDPEATAQARLEALARAGAPAGDPPELLAARLTELQWRLQRAEHELELTRARPVEALEAEVERLRRALDACTHERDAALAGAASHGGAEDVHAPAAGVAPAEPPPTATMSTEPPSAAGAAEAGGPGASEPAAGAAGEGAATREPAGVSPDAAAAQLALAQLRRKLAEAGTLLDRLIQRVERGGFSGIELRQRLLEWAEAQARPQWVIEYARAVMKQPSAAAPHDDHFHVRLYCDRDDRPFGCRDTGPVWRHEKKAYKYAGVERYDPWMWRRLRGTRAAAPPR